MLALLLTLTFLSQERPWDKVRAVESGTEVRVFKRNVKLPVVAKLDEATEDNLILLIEDQQVAIRRAEIDRIDRRPHQVSRVTHERRGVRTATAQGNTVSAAVANAARTQTLTIRSKSPFEFLYRRPTVLP